MIITWRVGLRLGAIVIATVVLQVSFLSFLSILGATPDAVPVVITALGLLGGAVTGAVAGFSTGLLLDAALLETLGVSSLALLAAGYLAGRYRESFEIQGRLTPALLAAALTLLATAIFTGLQLMLGVESAVSLLLLREMLVKALLAFLLALAVYPAIRFALRPALIDEEPRESRLQWLRRRRAHSRVRSRRARGTVERRLA